MQKADVEMNYSLQLSPEAALALGLLRATAYSQGSHDLALAVACRHVKNAASHATRTVSKSLRP